MFRMFCAQIQLLEVASIIAFKRRRRFSSPFQIISLQAKAFISLNYSGEMSPCGLGYLQTMTSEAELGKRFRWRAGARPRTNPLPPWICCQDGQFSQKPQGKISWDDGFGSWILL